MGEAGHAGRQDCPHYDDIGLQSQSQPEEEEEPEEEEAEELGHTEIYADYVPSKCECTACGRRPLEDTPSRHHRST